MWWFKQFGQHCISYSNTFATSTINGLMDASTRILFPINCWQILPRYIHHPTTNGWNLKIGPFYDPLNKREKHPVFSTLFRVFLGKLPLEVMGDKQRKPWLVLSGRNAATANHWSSKVTWLYKLLTSLVSGAWRIFGESTDNKLVGTEVTDVLELEFSKNPEP